VKTIGDYLRMPRFTTPNIVDSLVGALAKCVEGDSARMRSLMALWAMPLVSMMFKCDGESRDLQERAERVLRTVLTDMFKPPQTSKRVRDTSEESTGGGAATLSQPQQIVRLSTEFTSLLATVTKERLINDLAKLLGEPGREKMALRVWSVLVLLLGDKMFADLSACQ
jgi:hypothetical protein